MDCYMDLRNFPFDVQKCNLTLESCKFTDSNLFADRLDSV